MRRQFLWLASFFCVFSEASYLAELSVAFLTVTGKAVPAGESESLWKSKSAHEKTGNKL